MKEIRDNARKLMEGYCRVCPVCNGKACAGEVPGMGGLGTGSSFMANVNGLASVKLNMRLLHDIIEPDPSVGILGRRLALPVLAAPIGGVSFNMGGGVSEEDYISAVLDGCVDKGVLGCGGDGVPDVIHESANAAIKALDGRGIPFIKPWESGELEAKIDKAAEAGARVAGMDIDAAGLVTLRKMGRPVTPMGPNKLAKVIARFKSAIPDGFILKGIMTPDEALMAMDAGADAIVVSNHGGRVMDHAPSTVEVLSAINDVVRERMAVLVDGGVRTGADALKMLGLGADAVMIGRPFAIAAVGGLKEGVVKYLEQLKAELIQAMVMTGTAKASEVSESIIHN